MYVYNIYIYYIIYTYIIWYIYTHINWTYPYVPGSRWPRYSSILTSDAWPNPTSLEIVWNIFSKTEIHWKNLNYINIYIMHMIGIVLIKWSFLNVKKAQCLVEIDVSISTAHCSASAFKRMFLNCCRSMTWYTFAPMSRACSERIAACSAYCLANVLKAYCSRNGANISGQADPNYCVYQSLQKSRKK